MDLLARREHSLAELRRKLSRRFPDAEGVERALERLSRQGLQSDRRFAESFVRQRIERGQGPLRIAAEARQRGLSDDDLSEAMEGLQPDWPLLAQRVARGKFGDSAPATPQERARRIRFLQYRGFEFSHLGPELRG